MTFSEPDDISSRLKKLGFTANEAKAYIALLRCQPASAYEIAKTAGLPTSKIYETVSKLTGRGIFQSQTDNGGNQKYFAMSPQDLMESIRVSTISETQTLQATLEKIPGSNQSHLIWPLTDIEEVKGRVLELIKNSNESLLISLWPEEIAWCEEALLEAEGRGVRIAIVHFGKPVVQIGATYHHPVEKTLYEEKGGRGLTLVADGKEVVIANFGQRNAVQTVDGAWSRNPSFVVVAEDYVKHDVYITKVTRHLNAAMQDRYGEDYRKLRDVFDADI